MNFMEHFSYFLVFISFYLVCIQRVDERKAESNEYMDTVRNTWKYGNNAPFSVSSYIW